MSKLSVTGRLSASACSKIARLGGEHNAEWEREAWRERDEQRERARLEQQDRGSLSTSRDFAPFNAFGRSPSPRQSRSRRMRSSLSESPAASREPEKKCFAYYAASSLITMYLAGVGRFGVECSFGFHHLLVIGLDSFHDFRW